MIAKHKDITDKIVRAFYVVYNALGYGFLENVYEQAMVIELRKRGVNVIAQAPVAVYYDNEPVGDYNADLLVEDCVVVELKAILTLAPYNEAQLLNHLKATIHEVGLLLNFGPKPQIKRKVCANARAASIGLRQARMRTPLVFDWVQIEQTLGHEYTGIDTDKANNKVNQ